MTINGGMIKKNSGVFDDLLEVLFSPAKVFDRARDNSSGTYLLVLTIAIAVVVFATRSLIEPYMDAQMDLQVLLAARSGQPVAPEMAATMRSAGMWSFIGGSIVMIPVGALLTALFIWLGSTLVKAPLRYGQALVIASLTSVLRLLAMIATAVQGALLDPVSFRSMSDASLGGARFLDPETISPLVMQVTANLDLFNIWQLVLFAIGISVIARVNRGTGAAAAVIGWSIGVGLTLIPALRA